MAKSKNVFLKSKMNKDLDARLIPNGEYRNALNVQISSSQGSDVGAVENVNGNAPVFDFQAQTGAAGLECIGYVVDESISSAFLFLTNDVDHFLVKYNSTSGSFNILVKGAFLNFKKAYPIIGTNVVETLLFWTDNFNQPRKINWNTAVQRNTTTYNYYTNEAQISVAKFAPYTSPKLIDLSSELTLKPSTMSDAADLPDTTIGVVTWATENLNKKTFRDGTPILQAQSIVEWAAANNATPDPIPAWCYYDFNPANGRTYGIIYNEAVINSSKKIAPIGFSLPTVAQWNQLALSVGATTGSPLLKTINNSSPISGDFNFPYKPGTWIKMTLGPVDYSGTYAGNEFFDAIPGGYREGNSAGGTDFAGIGGSGTGATQGQTNIARWWAKGPTALNNEFVSIIANTNAITTGSPPSGAQDNPGYYIRCIRDDDYEGWNGDPDFLSDKFVTFSYRFKFDDNEYSLVAPFSQAAYVPQQDGYFFEGDEEKAFSSTIVNFMQNYINNVVLNIPLPSGSINEDYKVTDIDILMKESDGLVFKVIETIPVDSNFDITYTPRTTTTTAIGTVTNTKIITTDLNNGILPGYLLYEINGVALNPPVMVISVELNSTTTPPQYEITIAGTATYNDGDTFSWSYNPVPVYEYNYQSLKPYKTLPESEVVRVYDKVPVRAFAQESTGNRIMYGNFTANHASVQGLDYKISSGDKSLQEDIEYPNHNIKQNRNYKVGIILADKWGRQSDVILSNYDNILDEFGQPEKGSNLSHGYKRDSFQPSIAGWYGDNLSITFDTIIPEAINYGGISGYPGAYAISDFYTTDWPGQPFSGLDRFFKFVSQNANGTYTYSLFNVFDTPANFYTDWPTYFNSTKFLRGYYSDYTKIVSAVISTNPVPVNPVTLITENRISDSYLFEYTNSVDTLGGDKPQATFDINELGYYSYRLVVQQKQQDYYNVYLPGIVNGFPVNGNADERNDSAHITLINDNINKIPRDLKQVGPSQVEFNSSVKLFGRVQNSNNDLQRNMQYYPSRTADVVTLISSQKDMFGPTPDYTLTTPNFLNGNCFYPGFPIQFKEDQSAAVPATPVQFINSNPLIAKLNTVNGIGQVVDSWLPPTPGAYTYPDAMYLAVYETEPQTSVLDIYWESSTTGLISDLNTQVQGGSVLPTGFTDFTKAVDENDSIGTDITSVFYPKNSNGPIYNTQGVLLSVLSQYPSGGQLNQGDNRVDEFQLISLSDGGYKIRLNATQVALADYATAEYYFFTIEITNFEGDIVLLSFDTTLENEPPIFLPNYYTNLVPPQYINEFDYFNPDLTEGESFIMNGFDTNKILEAENGSADTNRKREELIFNIRLVTREFNAAGSTAEVVTDDFDTNQNPGGYQIGKTSLFLKQGADPLQGNYLYRMYVEVTDLSQTSPNSEGDTTEVVIGFIPQYQVYTGVVWAGYDNVGSGIVDVGTLSTDYPCNNFNPVFTSPSPFPGVNAQPPVSSVSVNDLGLTKRGSIANWTNAAVEVYYAIEAPQTASQPTDAKTIKGSGNGAAIIQANTFNTPFDYSPVIFPWGGNVLAASAAGSVPSTENQQMAHNIQLTLLENNITGSPNGRYGLIFKPANGVAPGSWTQSVAGVPIGNPPWPYNQDGTFANREPWLN